MTLTTDRWIRRLFWIVPLSLYLATLSPTIGYVDAALVLNNAHSLAISAWVNNHNLFSLLGWLWLRVFPLGSVFLRLNLLSALFGAGTVYVIFLCCCEYTRCPEASLVAALALMFSHSLWWHSTMLEVYTLNSLLMALILYVLLRYTDSGLVGWFWAALLFWGLGISNHMLMGLFAPAVFLFIILDRRSRRLRNLAVGGACLLLGMALFIFACVRSGLRYGSAGAVLELLNGGEFRTLMFSPASGCFWPLNYLFLLVFQYPSLCLIFLAWGLTALFIRPRRFELFLLTALAAQVLWSANFHIWDVYAYALPVYALAALPLARGLASKQIGRRLLILTALTLLAPVLLYTNAARIGPIRGWVARYPMVERVKDAFDPAGYFLNPDKHDFRRVERYTGELFSRLPENAWYYDDTYDYPIVYYYQRVLGKRTDLHCPIVFPFWITEEKKLRLAAQINSRLAAGDPVYVAPYIMSLIQPLVEIRESESVDLCGRKIYRLR